MWNSHEEIIDPEKGIVHKTIPGTLVAGFSFRSGYEELRKLIPANLEELEKLIGEFICGPAIVLLDYGVYSDAVHVEVAYPITSAVEKEGIRSWTLEPVEVLSVIHHGSHATWTRAIRGSTDSCENMGRWARVLEEKYILKTILLIPTKT